MIMNEVATFNARSTSEKKQNVIMNSKHISEITKGIDADDQLFQRYLQLIQTAKHANNGLVDSPPPSVRPENPSSPALKNTLSVAKTPSRKYREREYDRVAPATKLKTTTNIFTRSSSPQLEEYTSTPARHNRSKPRVKSNEALETYLYAAAGIERENVRKMLKACPALNHMPVSRIRYVRDDDISHYRSLTTRSLLNQHRYWSFSVVIST